MHETAHRSLFRTAALNDNTRTVLVSWRERLTVAPDYVNYHFEHHLVPARRWNVAMRRCSGA